MGSNISVEPFPDAENNIPYWIMQVPKSISSGHSDIFDKDLLIFAEFFLQRKEVFNPHSQIVLIKSHFDDRSDETGR